MRRVIRQLRDRLARHLLTVADRLATEAEKQARAQAIDDAVALAARARVLTERHRRLFTGAPQGTHTWN